MNPLKQLFVSLCVAAALIAAVAVGNGRCVCSAAAHVRFTGAPDQKIAGITSGGDFIIYQFIPFKCFVQDGKIVDFKKAGISKDAWFARFGIRTAHVVYHSLDPVVLKQVARTAKRPSIISLDLEQWSFYAPQTPQRIAQAVRAIRVFHPCVPVGVYGAAPVNTFGWAPGRWQKYDQLNPRYKVVADAVDFISPVLYSYQPSMKKWQTTARYDIAWAHRYGTSKPIIPYVSMRIRRHQNLNGKKRRDLTYGEMLLELKTLRRLGANGCIVWASSKSNEPLDPHRTGWLRAMIAFARRGR